MKLKSFGCSFVYGSDLSDCPHGTGYNHPLASQLTWPAILATQHGLEYHCHAWPSSGNLQILETLLSNINDPHNSIAMINWTWIDRFSYIKESERDKNNPRNLNGWCSLLPGDKDAVAEGYYRNLHCQFIDKLQTLVYIKVAIDAMKQAGIRFLMTYTDELIFETKWHISPAITDLQKYVRPYLVDFDSSSFWTWVINNDFAISKHWHPLEKAHAAAAELMCPAIDAILHRA
jgi:hypothetical protein